MAPLPNTPNFGLKQWEDTDDFENTEVNANFDKIDDLAPATVCTSGTRPVTSLFVGRTIYETDTDLFYFWDGNSWKKIVDGDNGLIFLNYAHDPVVLVWSNVTWSTTQTDIQLIGKRVRIYFSGVVNTVSAGAITVTLPGAPYGPTRSYINGIHVFGNGIFRDASAGQYVQLTVAAIPGVAGPIGAVAFYCPATGTNTNLTTISNTVPFAVAAGDQLACTIEYDLA